MEGSKAGMSCGCMKMWERKQDRIGRRSGDCLEFPWGGCQGNHNNFLTLAQCRYLTLRLLEFSLLSYFVEDQ